MMSSATHRSDSNIRRYGKGSRLAMHLRIRNWYWALLGPRVTKSFTKYWLQSMYKYLYIYLHTNARDRGKTYIHKRMLGLYQRSVHI